MEPGWVSAVEVEVGVSTRFVWVGGGVGSWLLIVAVGEAVAASLTGELGKGLPHAARVGTRRNSTTKKAKKEDFAE
jgi:hypothetical protein